MNSENMLVTFPDGYALLGDSTDEQTMLDVIDLIDQDTWMILTDPPYGNIVSDKWDKRGKGRIHAEWMLKWTELWSRHLAEGQAFYVWGGVGQYRDRPFFEYASRVEAEVNLKIQMPITWKKLRGIGTAYNYLFTREELLFMLKGGKNVKPLVFNVPLLDELRGYAGYSKKYPAKSPYKRRTNVWTDVPELLRNKVHPTEKPPRVCEIPIEVSSNQGHYVVDPFAGSGTTAIAARKLGRKFFIIEYDREIFEKTIKRLGGTLNTSGKSNVTDTENS